MKLVSNWKEILTKTWTARLAYIGIILPDLLQIVLQALDSSLAAKMDAGTKDTMRLLILAAIVMARPIQQNLAQK